MSPGKAFVDAGPHPGRLWPVGLVVLAGLALSMASFTYVRAAGHDRLEARFERETDALAGAMREGIARHVEVLHALHDYFDAQPTVSRAAFRAFVRGPLARHPGIRALEWVPVVPGPARARFEAEARRPGSPGYHPGFRILDRDARGALIPAAPQAAYHPVFYVEPLAGNERALGFAPADHPRTAALARARDRGGPAATGRFEPVQAARARYAVAVFEPVYRRPGVPRTLAARRAEVRGYLEGVFVLGEMLDAPMATARGAGIAATLIDAEAPEASRELLASLPASGPDAVPSDLRREVAVPIAGRDWRLAFRLADARPLESFRGPEWAVLAGGLVATGLLAGYLSSSLGQRERIEREVVERTASLRREKERAQRYLDVAAAMIVVIDREGRVTLINRQGSELLGWPQAEIVGSDWFERFVPARDRDAMRARVASVFAAARPGPYFQESPVLTRAGEERLIAWHATVLHDDAGRPIATLSSGTDVTDYKRAIAEVAAREAELLHVQAIDELKDHLAHAVSHDLRTPLTSIVGYAEFLAEGIGGPLSPAQEGYVGQITRAARRIGRLVDDLLDFARLEAGTFQVRQAPADLAAVAQEVQAAFKPQIEAAGLALTVPAAPVAWSFDAERVERVLTNLVGNAVKFTPAGGAIAVRAQALGDRLRVEVADTGPGIAQDQQAALFQRFSQLADGQAKGGTGLGLSICRAIVEAHGGTIGVESEPGQGATFWFELPA